MATLKDVARLAGVSITTVSHALNGTRHVQPDTAARVMAAVKDLGYSPNSVARGLRTGSSRTIGVVGPSAQDQFFGEVVVGVEQVCFERGYEVYLGFVESPLGVTCCEPVAELSQEQDFLRAVMAGRFDAPSPDDEKPMPGEDKEEELIAKLLAREVDGLIVNPGHRDEAVARLLNGIPARLALFHRQVAGVDADLFVSDDYAGTRRALEALLALGHRRIGMVYGYSWTGHAVRERFRAYRDAMQAAGVPVDVTLMLNGGYSLEIADDATRALLAAPRRPTAILYWSDMMAIAGMDAARAAGLSVPQDLSVVGFDDLPISRRVFPRLSSIEQQKAGIGAAMAARLIDRIEGKYEGAPEKLVLPTRYVQRESAGPAPASVKPAAPAPPPRAPVRATPSVPSA
ncbi:MAG TPA: LacI family DNA-binding transcriptional regulator [Spirochaetia bacterium]|nr:LacI family DNA-binding transcriptional regulator [Spirochaetia bacterium]